jgi:hypothetical protein
MNHALTASLKARDASRHLGTIVGALTLLSVAGQAARFSFLQGKVTWWVALFDVNREQNIPTYYQGISIFLAAMLLAAVARHAWTHRAPYKWAWTILAAGFVVLSMDETCMLHEQLDALMGASDHPFSGFFRYSWVIPAMAAVLIIGAGYVRFLLWLPAPTRRRFILSAAIYLAGAIGMEMIGGWYDERHGANNLTCQMLANVEELMEMGGIATFIVALLDYIAVHIGTITLDVRTADVPEVSVDLADEFPASALSSVPAGSTLHRSSPLK